MEQFLQFLHAKTATSSPEQFLKNIFFTFLLQRQGALGMRLAKIALCFIYSKNLKLYGKVLQQRSYLLLKGLVFKNISRYYDKDFKITSFESSHRRFSLRKYVLRNFAKFTGKHLCQLWYQSAQVFSCEFCENSRTPFSQNTSPGDCF